jgi:hypothetical protein
MKRTILSVGLLAALLTTAFGQENFLRAKVPFEFMLSGRACPAGTYEFSVTDQLVTAQNVETGNAVVFSFLSRLAEDNSANGTARISFDLSEGKRFVEAIWPRQGDGYLVHMVHTHEIFSADARIDEGVQLGSAYPEITQWPAHEIVSADARIDEGAQLGSAYPEITQWPAHEIVSADARIDEGAQLGSAYPEVTQWPDRRAKAETGGQ